MKCTSCEGELTFNEEQNYLVCRMCGTKIDTVKIKNKQDPESKSLENSSEPNTATLNYKDALIAYLKTSVGQNYPSINRLYLVNNSDRIGAPELEIETYDIEKTVPEELTKIPEDNPYQGLNTSNLYRKFSKDWIDDTIFLERPSDEDIKEYLSEIIPTEIDDVDKIWTYFCQEFYNVRSLNIDMLSLGDIAGREAGKLVRLLMKSMPRLQKFSLRHDYQTYQTDIFAFGRNLKQVHLYDDIVKVYPEQLFWTLRELREFRSDYMMDFNLPVFLPDFIFEKNEKLKKLELRNLIHLPRNIDYLENLEYLDISGSVMESVSSWVIDAIQKSTSLTTLKINGYLLVNHDPEEFFAPNLESVEVYIFKNPIISTYFVAENHIEKAEKIRLLSYSKHYLNYVNKLTETIRNTVTTGPKWFKGNIGEDQWRREYW